MIDAMIDLILDTARHERFDRTANPSDWQRRFSDGPAAALAHIATSHLIEVLAALNDHTTKLLAAERNGQRRSIFSNLNFLHNSRTAAAAAEAEAARMHVLAIECYRRVVAAADPHLLLPNVERHCVTYLAHQLAVQQELQKQHGRGDDRTASVLRSLLQAIATVASALLAVDDDDKRAAYRFCGAEPIMRLLVQLDVDGSGDRLALFRPVVQLATMLLRLQHRCEDLPGNADDDGVVLDLYYNYTSGVPKKKLNDDRPIFDCVAVKKVFGLLAGTFFAVAQQLRTKFDTAAEDVHNSLVAQHLNATLPELNALVGVVLERAGPATTQLDEVTAVLEPWLRDANSEVRICAGHVLNHALGVFVRQLGTSKGNSTAAAAAVSNVDGRFQQAAVLLAAIVPRCVDVNATVRQTAVAMLMRVLEIACVFDAAQRADDQRMEWMRELQRMHEEIVSDDARELQRMTGDVARIIAMRLSHFQYVQFW